MQKEPSIQSDQLDQLLQSISTKTNQKYKMFIENDPKLQRQDTIKGILHLLQQYKTLLTKTNVLSAQQKAKNYHIIYNIVSYISEISNSIQKSSFSFQAIKPLVQCIISLQGNLILTDAKYLDKRTQIYINICKIYEEGQYYQPAVLLLDGAIKKYQQLKSLYELDQPVPSHISLILTNNIYLLKILQIKFNIQGGILNANDWKKKVDEQFKDNLQFKIICLVECLRTQTKKHSNIFQKNLKSFKQSLVQQGYDLIKSYAEIIAKGLKEQKQKIQFQVTFKQKSMTQSFSQEQINDEIKKKRDILSKNSVKQSQFKKASQSFPLEYHAQLIYYAYQIKNMKILNELISTAMIRVQCRRIEVPYINDIAIIASNSPTPNIPNGYQKYPMDLNDANLRQQLKKLRKSGKTNPEGVTSLSNEVNNQSLQKDPKDAKKTGKQKQPPKIQEKSKQVSEQPSEWELSQINHKYVFMTYRKSMNPQNALYDMRLVLGHEQKGPIGYEDCRRIVVPYIQQNQNVILSTIQQYKGVKQSTQKVPYIILYHSRNNLQNEQQKKNVIVDVVPIIGKNPMIPAKLGYKKIQLDLRQVPEEFIKSKDHTYIYLSYKTDYQFCISSRVIQLFSSFVQLQNSFGQLKQGISILESQKFQQLQVKYDLQKLQDFFIVFQQVLKGSLGQQFYLQKNDFLTHFVLYLWKKYLRGALTQFEYVMEQKLNQQIIEQDYKLYKQIIDKCKPIFLKGLKVLNLIMINNPKCDILLLAKISLELIKLLQQSRDYYLASENAKLALDRIRVFRDQNLTKSVSGLQDYPLPFSLTCSNVKLSQIFSDMKKVYIKQRLELDKLNRIKNRQGQGKKPFNQQELQEEQLEFKSFRKNDQFDEVIENFRSKHLQMSSIIAAIDLDITNLYFRVALKHGQQLKKRGFKQGETVQTQQFQGLASTLLQKLGFLQTKSNKKQAKNLKQLQTTLIKAQKLNAPKPQTSRPQRKLVLQCQKNPYTFSLLLMNLAALNSGNQDKKYYLKQSLKMIYQCEQTQKKLINKCIENSIFIYSSLFDSQINTYDQNSSSIKPFVDLYNGIWPCQSQFPQPPILMGKNSQTIYVKLPPFIFKDKKKRKQIKYMKLFGKVSANGVDVSTNCDQLIGTGTKAELGTIIKVSHLKPNSNYCFAVAPINQDDQLMQIGKTSFDIPTYNPLSIPMIASYLAKISYQIGEYQIAEEAAKIVIKTFICQSNYYNPKTEKVNTIFKYSLNQQKLQKVSLLQIKAIAQSFYISGLCQRKKLQKNKLSSNKIVIQEKQNLISNLMLLAGVLQPVLSAPIANILFSIPNQENTILIKSFVLSLMQVEYMSPKLRKEGALIMQRIMKWGLQNNQISLARRILFKWTQRKWINIGKMTQIQEKKQNKKGGKDPKQAQDPKFIDKYCHFAIQKSPQVLQQFQDSLITMSQEYSDFLSLFLERVKQQINEFSQFADNEPQKIQELLSNLNVRLELNECLKDPVNNIKKFGVNSKLYLEYNCKIIRRALQMCNKSEYKSLNEKIKELQNGQLSGQVNESLQILSLIINAVQNDIQWSPESKQSVKLIMQKTGKDLSKQILIYTKYQQKMIHLTNQLTKKSFSFIKKQKDYDYIHLWLSQLHHLKAVSSLSAMQGEANQNQKLLKVQYKVKPIYTKLSCLKLQDLKKQKKQIEVIGQQKCLFEKTTLQKIQKFFKQIAEAIYSSYCIQNWQKLSNLFILLQNFINYYQITPFNHFNSKIWVWFATISIIAVQMLKFIKKKGINTYKKRYQQKLRNTQIQAISSILNPNQLSIFEQLYIPFSAVYYLPQLSAKTTKQPWFQQYKDLQISTISNIITYTVQCLYLHQKNNLIINILRQYCNVTQNAFSLQFLPFMINSQEKLAEEISKTINQKQEELNLVIKQYQKQKMGKKKRQAQITGEKMKYQIQYEEKSSKINESLKLLNQENHFILTQKQASKIVIREIQRDCNKASLSQKQQKKYLIQFGQDQQNIFKTYRAPSTALSSYEKDNVIQNKDSKQKQSMSLNRNKLNILSKNRNNILKDLISKYQSIYQQLKNNKTSKDPLAQIINRNDVGNLYFALSASKNALIQKNSSQEKRKSINQVTISNGLSDKSTPRSQNIQKSFQYWNDALATIFRKVNPIDNYFQIIEENKNNLVCNIGFKELLIALNIIYKISNFTCDKALSLIKNSISFSCFIVFQLFQTSLIHPQCLLQFSSYRLKTFQEYESQFLHESVNMNELIQGLQNLIWKGLDYLDQSQYIMLTPVSCLFQYLSIDIVKNNKLALKSKILKSIILSFCGCIRQSSLCLMFVCYEKDLPILWLQKSQNLKKQKGQNWFPGTQNPLFIESRPFFASQNKEPIQSIKKLTYPLSFKKQLSPQLQIIFSFSKNLLLSKIYSQELSLQNFDQNQERISNLKEIQNNLRQNLKRASVQEEYFRLSQELQDAKISFSNNEIDQNQIKKKETQITSYLKNNSYEDIYINKIIQQKNTEGNTTIKRINLIQLMTRLRFCIHKLNLLRKIYINSFYVLKNGLKNFNRYCYGSRKVETGYDPEVSQIPSPLQVGKKQDKKGGKKQEEASKPIINEMDSVVEQKIKKQNERLLKRLSPSPFWHIKLTYQIGVVLYQQNNFISALTVFEQLAILCQKYGQKYYKAYGDTFSQRCKIRLGNFRRQKIIQLISLLQNQRFVDYKFVCFVMDAGEMFHDQIRKQLFGKGLKQCQRLWQLVGMNKYIIGIGLTPPQNFYGYSDELTAQEQQLVRRKDKKLQKKGGKQQKKGAKKDDGKKKKEQIKNEFKISPLFQTKQINLQEDEQSLTSMQFKKYSLESHPNLYQINIYNDMPKKYIKCWLRLWNSLSKYHKETQLGNFDLIEKLVFISEKYPENSCQKLSLLRVEGQFYKNKFLNKFQTYLSQLKKSEFNELKIPYQDLPRNQKLNCLPSYAIFLNQNKKLLQKASESYKKLMNLVQKTPLILQNDQNLEDIPFEYSYICSLQIQFTGTLIPKHLKLKQENDIISSKKQTYRKAMSRFVKLLKYSIDLSTAKRYLVQEYYQIGKKQLQPNVKIDQDVLVQIKNMDKQSKSLYPHHLKQSVKPKQNINSIDLLTYLLKLKRQSQVMTFGNPLQNNLNKCYRILSTSLLSFKQKCVISFPDFDKIQYENDQNMLIIRSKRQIQIVNNKEREVDMYLYVVGKQKNDVEGNYVNQPYYGKIYIPIDEVSNLLQECHKIQSKLKQSLTLSEPVKNRNFTQCQKPFSLIIEQISKKFSPKLNYSFLQSQDKSKLPKLSEQNVNSLIKLLSGQLFKSEGGQMSQFLRLLHKWKYNLIEAKGSEKQKLTKDIQGVVK